jgi:transcriptional antiterminator NusG
MANKWYVVHTYSGHEDKVKKNLEIAVANQSLQDTISQIIVPTEEVVEIKNNKKKIKKRKFYPGYVFVEMTITNVAYWLIKNINGVTGFLGGVKPIAMSENEVKNFLATLENQEEVKPRPAILFQKEENVRIIDGPFTHFIGNVEEVNHERGKIKVMVTIFGRPTPVELDFLQVEKI